MGDFSESRSEKNEKNEKNEKKSVGRSGERGRGRVVLMVSVTLTAACYLVSLHSTLKDTAYQEKTDDQFSNAKECQFCLEHA